MDFIFISLFPRSSIKALDGLFYIQTIMINKFYSWPNGLTKLNKTTQPIKAILLDPGSQPNPPIPPIIRKPTHN